MTPFKERMNLYRAYRELNPDKNYWDWKQSLEVPAMQGGGNTEDARFSPIDAPVIPKSHDLYYTNWQSNWLNRRREQLYNNLDDMRYSTSGWISLKEQNNDIRDNKWNYDHNQGDYSILPLLKGESPDRVWINKEYYKQLNNAAIAPDTTLNASFGGVNGAYVPLDAWDATGHYIIYPEDANLSTKIHERTHASNPRPQEEKILNITGYGKSKKSAGVDYESYIRDPREVYARLMQFRHDLRIDPSKVFGAEDLNTYRKELEKYNLHIFSDDQLLRILNEVASNDVKLEPLVYSAKNGGVIPAMLDGGEITDLFIAQFGDAVTYGKDDTNLIGDIGNWWNDLTGMKNYGYGYCAITPNGKLTTQCAKYSNDILRNQGYKNITGDAWNRAAYSNMKPIISGYTGLKKPNKYTKDAAHEYLRNAANNFAENVDTTLLITNDVIGIYYPDSPNTQKAFEGGQWGETQTHTGHTIVGKDGTHYVVHNVDGHLKINKLADMLTGKYDYLPVSAYRPRK